MTPDQERRIDRLVSAFEAHGYVVSFSPIEGQEETFIAGLRDGWKAVEKILAFNAATYGMRGLSKRARAALHEDLPQPVWGVDVAPVIGAVPKR